MTEQEKRLEALANQLYSRGLAASLWDARNKARDILGLSSQKIEQIDNSIKSRIGKTHEDESDVHNIMKSAGVNISDLKSAEIKKIEEVKKDFMLKNEENADDNVILQDNAESNLNQDVLIGQPAEKVDAAKELFFDSVEGATPDMTVSELFKGEEGEEARPENEETTETEEIASEEAASSDFEVGLGENADAHSDEKTGFKEGGDFFVFDSVTDEKASNEIEEAEESYPDEKVDEDSKVDDDKDNVFSDLDKDILDEQQPKEENPDEEEGGNSQ